MADETEAGQRTSDNAVAEHDEAAIVLVDAGHEPEGDDDTRVALAMIVALSSFLLAVVLVILRHLLFRA